MGVLMDEQLNRGTKDGCVNGWANTRDKKLHVTINENRTMGESTNEKWKEKIVVRK